MHSPAPPQAIEPQRLSIHLKLANDEYGAEGETFQLYDVEDAIGAAIELLASSRDTRSGKASSSYLSPAHAPTHFCQ